METCYVVVFYVGALGHNRLPLGRILLPQWNSSLLMWIRKWHHSLYRYRGEQLNGWNFSSEWTIPLMGIDSGRQLEANQARCWGKRISDRLLVLDLKTAWGAAPPQTQNLLSGNDLACLVILVDIQYSLRYGVNFNLSVTESILGRTIECKFIFQAYTSAQWCSG